MSNYIKGFNTSDGKKPIFPPAADGKVWGTKDGEWQPVDPEGGVDETQLNEAVEAALERAKESGEFDGPKGDPFTYEDFTPEQLEDLRGPSGPGVTIASVTESTEDGGVNVVTFSDGNTLNVRNGKKGDPGYTPQKGIDYFDGARGDPGHTPQKGTDYFTEADKQELVAAVLTALPRAEEAEF